MPPFGTGSGVGSTYATCLLTFPNVDWFKWNIAGAINQMTEDFNWSEDGDVGISFAVEEAEKTLETMVFMNFNPIPIGLIHPFGSATPPDGYLLCDGASYATDDYPELFGTIGYSFGGSGANFSVPSLYNRVPVGSGDLFALADTGGEATHVLTTAESASHSHNDAGHSHSIPLVTSLPAQAGVGFAGDVTVPILTMSTGTGFASLDNSGGDGAHNNMQPYQAVSYIIYAGQ